MIQAGTETSIDDAPLTPAQLCRRAALAHSVPIVARFHHVDARYRVKLRGMFELLMPVMIDAWRTRCGIEELFNKGVWPVAAYYDADLAEHPIAPGYTGGATSSACLGRVPERALMLAGELCLLAHRSSGQPSKLRERFDPDAPAELSARLRFMVNLIQPFKPPSEFVLRDVPPELSGLEQFPCTAPPTTSELASLEPEFENAGSAPEFKFVWALHHSDSTQLICNTEYVFAAEEHCARTILAAGESLMAYKLRRMQTVYKRPFMPSQSCALRGTLWTRESDPAAVVLIGFHSVDAAGVVHDKPAVLVRFDAHFEQT